jgi:RES domain-containing protein
MRLFRLCEPLIRHVYCHGPASLGFDADTLVTADDGNRWNLRGEPTIYLAGDPGVATVELGRHLPRALDAPVESAVWRVRLSLERVLDLRRADVRAALHVPGGWQWLTDRRHCRELAGRIRAAGDCEAVIVPSVGFPDQFDRMNVVVFVDRLGAPTTDVVAQPVRVGTVRLEPAASSGRAEPAERDRPQAWERSGERPLTDAPAPLPRGPERPAPATPGPGRGGRSGRR